MRSCVILLTGLVAMPALAAPCGGTQGEGFVRVTIEATGVRDARGEVAVTVYPDIKRRFLAKGGKRDESGSDMIGPDTCWRAHAVFLVRAANKLGRFD